jgi:hypothetical protein
LRRARGIFVSLARETGYTLTDLRGILREKFQCYLAWQPWAKRQGRDAAAKGKETPKCIDASQPLLNA